MKRKPCASTLADFFEAQPPTARNCDERPWLLWQTGLDKRLRNCLLDMDCFLEIHKRDEDELRAYWVYLKQERSIGKPYLDSFNTWAAQEEISEGQTSHAANELGLFLNSIAL